MGTKIGNGQKYSVIYTREPILSTYTITAAIIQSQMRLKQCQIYLESTAGVFCHLLITRTKSTGA